MKLLTCNIRFSSMGCDSGVRNWKNRCEYCLETMLSRKPDILCLQECHNDQFSDLRSGLGSDWSAYWIMSFPGGYYPENAIFYVNHDRQELDMNIHFEIAGRKPSPPLVYPEGRRRMTNLVTAT